MSPPLYLDHAATRWPKASGVADAIAAATRDIIGNAGRSTEDSAAIAIDRCRVACAQLLRLSDPGRVALTHGCTDALNLAILGVLAHRRDKPHVVSTVLEHNSVRRPLRHLQRLGTITLTEVTCDHEGFVDPAAVGDACTAQTALVACTHASNVVGTIQDLAAIGGAIRTKAPEALFLVDAAQTAGVLSIDPGPLNADLVAFGAHKAIGGPAGIGMLYIGPRAFDPRHATTSPLQPVAFGGTGNSGSADSDDMPRSLPARFEPGTRNPALAAGVVAALLAMKRDGSVLAHERALIRRLMDGLAAVPSVRIIGPRGMDRRLGVLALQTDAISATELAAALYAGFSIVARPGVQCAPAAHAALGTGPDGTLRISVGPDTTSDDIDRLLAALREVLRS